MSDFTRRRTLMILASVLTTTAACGSTRFDKHGKDKIPLHPHETPELRAKINQWSDYYEVPRELTHRIIQRESGYRPEARNGPYYGLMQIHPRTARGMGHYGPAAELLDADVNLKYAVKYLRGAWMVSDGSYDKAVHWYASGYYYEAKRRGLLEKTGLKT